MEDDDADFTPSSSTSSNLNSLFGFNKKPLQGNLSLTYTAPKAPKKESSPAKKQAEEKKNEKILCKQVYSFKLQNRVYVNQGLTGLIISGNHSTHIYEIILYKASLEELCHLRITKNFLITLSPNNYISFYDNNKQNWSILFQSPEDVEQFALMIAICKFYSNQNQTDILTQDLTPLTSSKVDLNSAVEICYSCKKLKPESASTIKEDIKEKLGLSHVNFIPFKEGLIGSSESSKRAIIAPHSKSGLFSSQLDSNSDLLLIVKIDKILPKSENLTFDSKSMNISNNLVDSSSEDSNVEIKGNTVNEMLSGIQSQKPNLVHKVPQKSPTTLNLKQNINAGFSDSEEESLAASPKPRIFRRTAGNTSNHSISQSMQIQKPETQQVSVYQNDLSWQQSQLAKLGLVHQGVMSASPLSSPTTDPNFSVYVSESRVQAAELRMGISKVSEKLDIVMNSLQTLNKLSSENKIFQGNLIDSSGILSSIQALITENESLKGKVEEQREKIEQQNNRIFHLLELNHKYLEKNSATVEKPPENEFKLKTEIESLRKKETQLETENKKLLETINGLEKDLTDAEEVKKNLTKLNENMKMEIEEIKKNLQGSNELKKKELETWEEKMGKAAEAVTKLKERLREVISENENLKSVINVQKGEIETRKEETDDTKKKNEEYEKVVEGLKKQISIEENKSESKIEDLANEVTKLEEENKILKLKVEEEKKVVHEVAMKIYSNIGQKFSSSKDYSILEILGEIKKNFEEMTGVTFPQDEKHEIKLKNSQNVENEKQEKLTEVSTPKAKNSEEIKGLQEKTKLDSEEFEVGLEKNEEKEGKITEINERKENDHRYQSYDQSWRSTKPPPPPLFDDKDEDDDWLN